MTIEWIHAFLDEIYRIDDFFREKQDDLINEFISLQDKLRMKSEKFSKKANKDKKKKN